MLHQYANWQLQTQNVCQTYRVALHQQHCANLVRDQEVNGRILAFSSAVGWQS